MFNSELYPVLSPHVVETYYLNSLFGSVVKMIRSGSDNVKPTVYLSILVQIFLQLEDSRKDEKNMLGNGGMVRSNSSSSVRSGVYERELHTIIISCVDALKIAIQDSNSNGAGEDEIVLAGVLACKCLSWLVDANADIITLTSTTASSALAALVQLWNEKTDTYADADVGAVVGDTSSSLYSSLQSFLTSKGEALTTHVLILVAQLGQRNKNRDNNTNTKKCNNTNTNTEGNTLALQCCELLCLNPRSVVLSWGVGRVLQVLQVDDIPTLMGKERAMALFDNLCTHLST